MHESIREWAKRYRDLAFHPDQTKKREQWAANNSLDFQKPLILILGVPYEEFFDDSVIKSEQPLLRWVEAWLVHAVSFQQTLQDDFIYEPYYTLRMTSKAPDHLRWGLPCGMGEKRFSGGAAAFTPSLLNEDDLEKLQPIPDVPDEEETQRNADLIRDAIGDILDVHVNRQAVLSRQWNRDISTDLAKLRGLEQLMWDVYDNPEFLHKILKKMQTAILDAIDSTEARGGFTLAEHINQAMPYCRELAYPDCHTPVGSAKELWGFMSSQEFTSVGQRQFDEFMLDYQRPIMERFGLSAYGCCEDLTHMIGSLRRIKNLRRIAVTPFADVRKCAEQIGRDYVLSYRPNPSSMVSRGLDEDFVRATMRDAFAIFKENGNIFDITLKDVETLCGQPQNMARWVRIVREEIDRAF